MSVLEVEATAGQSWGAARVAVALIGNLLARLYDRKHMQANNGTPHILAPILGQSSIVYLSSRPEMSKSTFSDS